LGEVGKEACGIVKGMSYKWPLNTSQFTFWDKVRIAKYILTDDQWTQSKYVKEIEDKLAKYVGCKYAVYVSSGSTANTLIAMYLRDNLKSNKRYIIFPSTTWVTSVSPFIREGFEPIFVDVTLKDFAINIAKLEEVLEQKASQVACVFITSLLGFVPDIEALRVLEKKYNVRIMLDNCENTFGQWEGKNVSSYFTSTTSSYFGHQIQSVEGGFVFTNDEHEYHYFLMARNHGMTRLLPENVKHTYQNKLVDPRFDFFILGNNFRNSDINAFIGLQDIKRIDQYHRRRVNLYSLFRTKTAGFYRGLVLPKVFTSLREHSPFCLPIIYKEPSQQKVTDMKGICNELGIETRPVISGNLLRHTCFQAYDKPWNFPVSEHLNNFGFYVGLHNKVTTNQVSELADNLNKIL
jgi:CDP-4-dehydro-6-deoxyglucose reductase, E1